MKALNVVTKDSKMMSVFSSFWFLKMHDKINEYVKMNYPDYKGNVMDNEELFNTLLIDISKELLEYLNSDLGFEERQNYEKLTELVLGK